MPAADATKVSRFKHVHHNTFIPVLVVATKHAACFRFFSIETPSALKFRFAAVLGRTPRILQLLRLPHPKPK